MDGVHVIGGWRLTHFDERALSPSGCRYAGRELTQKGFRPSAAPPKATNSRGEWNAGRVDAVGGDEKDRSRHRVRGVGG